MSLPMRDLSNDLIAYWFLPGPDSLPTADQNLAAICNGLNPDDIPFLVACVRYWKAKWEEEHRRHHPTEELS